MNIKKYLQETLEDKEILDLLADKKVYFLHANGPQPPYIEYEILNEAGEVWHEGKEIVTNYSIQVDIFSKKDYTEIETKVKEKMIEKGFIRNGSGGLFDKDTKLFHKIMRFSISGLAE